MKGCKNMVWATLCYLTKDNKTLMLYRNKKNQDVHEGKWIGLGGKIEENETPDECMLREVFEEAGIHITEYKFRGTLTYPKFTEGHTWNLFVYMAFDYEGEIQPCNEGELKWIDNNDILNLSLWEGDKIFLKWLYESEKCFSAKFTNSKSKNVTYNVNFY